jgi:hypothetical protein
MSVTAFYKRVFILPAAVLFGCAGALAQGATVAFEFDSSSASEALTHPEVDVVLSTAQQSDVQVSWESTGITATAGGSFDAASDFIAETGTVVIPAGETSAVIALTIINDSEVEKTEELQVALTGAAGAELGALTTHEYAILDDDAPGVLLDPETPRVQFTLPESEAAEDAEEPVIAVTLSSAQSSPIEVEYVVTPDTAEGGGVDYELASGTLTFAEEEVLVNLEPILTDDQLAEKDETFTVTLIDTSEGELGDITEHEFTILDNDPVQARFTEETSSEPESTTPVRVTVELSDRAPTPITVDYTLSGTADGEEDYSHTVQPLVFAEGESERDLVFEITQDFEPEGAETIVVKLTTITPPMDGEIGDPDTHTIDLKEDDESYPTVHFAKDENRIANPGAQTFGDTEDSHGEMVVVLSRGHPEQVRVDYEVAGGTAEGDGVDYEMTTSDTLVFEPETTRVVIPITVIDDDREESDETITVELKNPEKAQLSEDPSGTYWIIDNDGDLPERRLFRQDVPTRTSGQIGGNQGQSVGGKVVLVGPRTSALRPGGIAVDRAGNSYISDQGPSSAPGEGALYMMPAGQSGLLRLASGLDIPGDVELSPDQSAVLIAQPDGAIWRKSFGLSISITNINTLLGNTTVFVKSDKGTRSAQVSPDGWFHVLDILGPGQESATVDIVIEHRGKTRSYQDVQLGQPFVPVEEESGQTNLFGQRLVRLEL